MKNMLLPTEVFYKHDLTTTRKANQIGPLEHNVVSDKRYDLHILVKIMKCKFISMFPQSDSTSKSWFDNVAHNWTVFGTMLQEYKEYTLCIVVLIWGPFTNMD